MFLPVVVLTVSPLPPFHIQEHLAETYFANCHVPYIVLHKPSFMKQISEETVAPALLLAVCAVSAR
jgi:Fungal specific transcription factor domain